MTSLSCVPDILVIALFKLEQFQNLDPVLQGIRVLSNHQGRLHEEAMVDLEMWAREDHGKQQLNQTYRIRCSLHGSTCANYTSS